jgi:hypothetical protein
LQIGRGDRVAGAVEGYLSRARRLAQLGQSCPQDRHLGGRRPQSRLKHPLLLQGGLALAVKVVNRGDDDEITNPQHRDQQRECKEPPGAARRQIGDRGYGATSALMVNTSKWLASMRVTGAVKVGLRSWSPAARIAINREAAADRPLIVTLRCCCTSSVR